ncbi:MAG TPA: urease accessory UreF family protein [Pseudonocardiaceae bacterium]|jgi:urease accessory protein|nr:urease accessory UreF family protein [Pseudonocardiaceae bacterium]
MTTPAVLLLADSRLPSGSHAHSGGVEMAVTAGLLSTVDDLLGFLRGRLRTTGPVSAGFAAAACLLAAGPVSWADWDDALSARIPAPELRTASRAQGAALLRTVSRIWSTPALTGLRELGRPHQLLVLGAAIAAGGGTGADAAALALHHLVGGACSAAVRLLGLDPLDVAAAQGAVAGLAAEVAAEACPTAELAVSTVDSSVLPATGAPLPELLAVAHAQLEVSLFAS